VELEAERVEVYRLAKNRYEAPTVLERKDTLAASEVPGFEIGVGELLGPPEDPQLSRPSSG
jgi:hypothetical protein